MSRVPTGHLAPIHAFVLLRCAAAARRRCIFFLMTTGGFLRRIFSMNRFDLTVALSRGAGFHVCTGSIFSAIAMTLPSACTGQSSFAYGRTSLVLVFFRVKHCPHDSIVRAIRSMTECEKYLYSWYLGDKFVSPDIAQHP